MRGGGANSRTVAALSIAAPVRAGYVSRRSASPHKDLMTTFDDRERGFENQFAHDQEQEFRAAARRNRALGRWAAGLMGLEGQHLDDYAQAIVKSELDPAHDDDVLRKVFEDLKGSGVAVTEGDVRMKMAELMAQARDEVKKGK